MAEGKPFAEASVTAALVNNREQKILEIELSDIERQWWLKLKSLARERLDVLLELYKYIKTQPTAGHLSDDMVGEKLTTYFEQEVGKRKDSQRKRSDKFNLRSDEFARIPLHFPDLEKIFDERDCFSSCAVASISAFASSWSLMSASSDSVSNSSDQKLGLVSVLNKSLRHNVPYRKTVTPRKKVAVPKRKLLDHRPRSTIPSLPEIVSTTQKKELAPIPSKKSVTVRSPQPLQAVPVSSSVKSPAEPGESADKTDASNQEQTVVERSTTKTEKEKVSSRWILPGIV